MPTYVYECAKCGEEVEIWQSFKDDPLKRHPSCGGKLTKVYQPVGIVLKGPGFYKTDSRNGKKATASSDRSESSSDSGSSSSDSKSEKSESKSESNSGSKSDSGSGSKSSDSKKSSKAPSKTASKSS